MGRKNITSLGAIAIPASTGLRFYEKTTARMRADCWLCKRRIGTGEWRMDYRMRATTSLRDQRRIHATCAGNLPAETREVDQRYVRHAFALTAELESKEMLKRVAFDLGFEM